MNKICAIVNNGQTDAMSIIREWVILLKDLSKMEYSVTFKKYWVHPHVPIWFVLKISKDSNCSILPLGEWWGKESSDWGPGCECGVRSEKRQEDLQQRVPAPGRHCTIKELDLYSKSNHRCFHANDHRNVGLMENNSSFFIFHHE